MLIVKVMKRKDASSVLVAIVMAMIVSTPLTIITGPLTSKIVVEHNGPFSYPTNLGWKDQYLSPIVSMVLEIIVLEILLWIAIYGMRLLMVGSRKTKE